MPYCTDCGAKVDNKANFCSECGFNLTAGISTAMEVDFTTAKEHRNLALNYRLKDEWDNAVLEYTKAIELDNNFTLAYFERGELHKLLGAKPEAIADFEKVVGLSNKPETVEAAERYLKELQ